MRRKIFAGVAVNAILMGLLFLSVSFNKEYLRPAFAGIPVLSVIAGSFSNFIAAYFVSCFPVYPIIKNGLNRKKGTMIVVATATTVFIILTVEEFSSFFGASAVSDGYDVIASAIGSSCAILTFLLLRRFVSRRRLN